MYYNDACCTSERTLPFCKYTSKTVTLLGKKTCCHIDMNMILSESRQNLRGQMKVNYTDWMHVHGRETYCLQITIIDPVVTQRLCWWFCTCVYMYIWLPQETTIVKMTYFSSLQQFVVCLYFVFYLVTLWGIHVLVLSSFLFYF